MKLAMSFVLLSFSIIPFSYQVPYIAWLLFLAFWVSVADNISFTLEWLRCRNFQKRYRNWQPFPGGYMVNFTALFTIHFYNFITHYPIWCFKSILAFWVSLESRSATPIDRGWLSGYPEKITVYLLAFTQTYCHLAKRPGLNRWDSVSDRPFQDPNYNSGLKLEC